MHPNGRWSALHQAVYVSSSTKSAVSLLFPPRNNSRADARRAYFFRRASRVVVHARLLLPAEAGVQPVVEYLLHMRADVNVTNRDGKYPADPRR